ncbi:hypothetical protein EC844_10894 [Acinetobacter calcoaceticus]|uniref:Preprotein translocase subunit SecA n=1 Tax=Acinetobacter calcoaceticus TaxID=471 RepID=A0A4R1XT39_ACICA|nr:hypothetical protein EC844_10894 [Acinetobacter calcoaceticus]
MSESQHKARHFRPVRHDTLAWKLFLIYDIFMMLIIVVNLFCLSANAILMSNFSNWLFDLIQLDQALLFYKSDLYPWVVKTESWFITFLIAELMLRWGIAILRKHHQRWFFFPFIHWYEVLAIIPVLRFLRLFRAGVIAYRLHEMGYTVIPENMQKKLKFYYGVIMEELSDRVVVTVIDGARYELDNSSSHKKIIHDLVDHHRQLLARALAEVLQESLATELKIQQQTISHSVGQVVNQAIADTPELTQILRKLPIVGGILENQIQSIGQRLGENISLGLIQPLTSGSVQQPNQIYQLISEKISTINIENQTLEQLVESAVYESLASIRKQVKIKQWQIELNKSVAAKD